MRAPAALVAALCALAWPAASAAPGDVWAKLHRPLHVPRLVAGARCRVPDRLRPTGLGARDRAAGIGQQRESAWGGQKVLWLVTPAYRGPVLIRGRRLDGPQLVRFEGAGVRVPPAELRITPTASVTGNLGVPELGQRYRPS
jgi:hypothetical protein